jgi:hypothetical protein
MIRLEWSAATAATTTMLPLKQLPVKQMVEVERRHGKIHLRRLAGLSVMQMGLISNVVQYYIVLFSLQRK